MMSPIGSRPTPSALTLEGGGSSVGSGNGIGGMPLGPPLAVVQVGSKSPQGLMASLSTIMLPSPPVVPDRSYRPPERSRLNCSTALSPQLQPGAAPAATMKPRPRTSEAG